MHSSCFYLERTVINRHDYIGFVILIVGINCDFPRWFILMCKLAVLTPTLTLPHQGGGNFLVLPHQGGGKIVLFPANEGGKIVPSPILGEG